MNVPEKSWKNQRGIIHDAPVGKKVNYMYIVVDPTRSRTIVYMYLDLGTRSVTCCSCSVLQSMYGAY